MKNIILMLTLLMSITMLAQQENKTKNLFIRVYDLDGNKIGKGWIYAANDSILTVEKNDKLKQFYVKDIGKIKTKRSGGNNVLIGASSGILVGAVLGVANPPTESSGGTFTWAGGSSGEEFASGVTLGLFTGTIIGGFSALFKNPKTYIIEADNEKWKIFRQAVQHNIKQ